MHACMRACVHACTPSLWWGMLSTVASSCFSTVAPSCFSTVAPSCFSTVASSCFSTVASSCFSTVAPSCFSTVAPSCFSTVAPSCLLGLQRAWVLPSYGWMVGCSLRARTSGCCLPVPPSWLCKAQVLPPPDAGSPLAIVLVPSCPAAAGTCTQQEVHLTPEQPQQEVCLGWEGDRVNVACENEREGAKARKGGRLSVGQPGSSSGGGGRSKDDKPKQQQEQQQQ